MEAYRGFFTQGYQHFQKLEAKLKVYQDDLKKQRMTLMSKKDKTVIDAHKSLAGGLVFGVPLKDLVQREQTPIPKLVMKCIEWLETNGNILFMNILIRHFSIGC